MTRDFLEQRLWIQPILMVKAAAVSDYVMKVWYEGKKKSPSLNGGGLLLCLSKDVLCHYCVRQHEATAKNQLGHVHHSPSEPHIGNGARQLSVPTTSRYESVRIDTALPIPSANCAALHALQLKAVLVIRFWLGHPNKLEAASSEELFISGLLGMP